MWEEEINDSWVVHFTDIGACASGSKISQLMGVHQFGLFVGEIIE